MSNSTPTWQPRIENVNPYAAPRVQKTVRVPGIRDPLGSRLTRLLASIIDSLVFIPSGVLLGFCVAISPEDITLAFVAAGIGVLFTVIIQLVFLSNYSATIGKKLLSLYVADYKTGEPAGWVTTILLRAVLGTVLSNLPYFGGIYAIIDALFIFRADKRCIHDLIANTVVLKKS